ncbi:polymorphic toxin type 44 domain-containing protein [Amycolatopsis palatopharyngis]|uniref:polymorphic toxin type 44 domain-containing protein n=1 Tax=Amycolatopsis palatopharyngis TaxID=187982 RepID=UPI001B86E1CF|nr:polymorphic toxin type 44 domain-containing protein [Amycolatopsis palatopharyngis]
MTNAQSDTVGAIGAMVETYRGCTEEPSLMDSVRCGFVGVDDLARNALTTWFSKVCENVCEWDHKPKIEAMLDLEMKGDYFLPVKGKEDKYELYYDIWSNIHYGYVGRAAGFSGGTLQSAAGSGVPGVGANYVGDEVTVQIGIDLYARYKPNELTAERLQQAVLAAIPRLRRAGASQLIVK